jgi:hypothetical protein
MPKVYKRHGKSLGAVEFWRTKRMVIQQSTTEYEDWKLVAEEELEVGL